jgi:hypothetical protein
MSQAIYGTYRRGQRTGAPTETLGDLHVTIADELMNADFSSFRRLRKIIRSRVETSIAGSEENRLCGGKIWRARSAPHAEERKRLAPDR